MKCAEFGNDPLMLRRSRKGAWIEITAASNFSFNSSVAPVRERGLKFTLVLLMIFGTSRSRKGAWIEILLVVLPITSVFVAPVRERGLKYHKEITYRHMRLVAPVRERGLKYGRSVQLTKN